MKTRGGGTHLTSIKTTSAGTHTSGQGSLWDDSTGFLLQLVRLLLRCYGGSTLALIQNLACGLDRFSRLFLFWLLINNDLLLLFLWFVAKMKI